MIPSQPPLRSGEGAPCCRVKPEANPPLASVPWPVPALGPLDDASTLPNARCAPCTTHTIPFEEILNYIVALASV